MTAITELPIEASRVHEPLEHCVLEVSLSDGLSAVTRALARSPLKLVVPRSRGENVWVFASTFGGGLVSGDRVELNIRCGPGTTTLLSTQASTKIYRANRTAAAQQTLVAKVEPGALLVLAPDPVTCFGDSVYEQRQRFELAGDGGLVLVDWFTSGRAARGERWAFSRYHACNEILLDGQLIYRDVMLLDPRDGPLASPRRMGRYDCVASAVVAGGRLKRHAVELAEWIARQSVGGEILFSASPLRGGVVLRAAGPSSETVGRWLRERLWFVVKELGEDPWGRKY